MQYACVAAAQAGARCRQFVEVNDFDFDTACRCYQHQRSEASIASAPDVVLIKFRVNWNWARRFRSIGITPKQVDFGSRETRHVKHAHNHGRKAYQIRPQIADSGVPVFGRDGLQNVSPLPGIDATDEYDILDVRLEPARDNNDMFTLILTLAKEGEIQSFPREVATEVGELISSTWGFCHIWANPPRDDGKVVHTVNLSHRQPAAKPTLQLVFNNGLWAVEPA